MFCLRLFDKTVQIEEFETHVEAHITELNRTTNFYV